MPKKQNKSDDVTTTLSQLADEDYCYVTTVGRVTGKPHEIEIWFGARDETIYLLSGGGDKSDWVKNMRVQPRVDVRIAKRQFTGQARFDLGAEEESQARRMLAAKYQGWREGRKLSEWAREALPVAIELKAPSLRGKYKGMGLMKALMEEKKREREL